VAISGNIAPQQCFIHDGIIAGLRERAATNSPPAARLFSKPDRLANYSFFTETNERHRLQSDNLLNMETV